MYLTAVTYQSSAAPAFQHNLLSSSCAGAPRAPLKAAYLRKTPFQQEISKQLCTWTGGASQRHHNHFKLSCRTGLEMSLPWHPHGPSLGLNCYVAEMWEFPKEASFMYYFSLQEMPTHKQLQGKRMFIQVMLWRKKKKKIKSIAALGRGCFSFWFQTSSQRPPLSNHTCKKTSIHINVN